MSSSPGKMAVSTPGNVGVVRLSGDVDLTTAEHIRQRIFQALARHDYRIIIDLANVNYLDSSGIGALVAGLKLAREHNGDLSLSGLTPRIREVMSLTGLEKVFCIFPDEQMALSAISSGEVPQ